MKVRKFLFAGALIVASLFSVNSVMAQTTATDEVTVNLKFMPVMSITVNVDNVDLTYKTVDDYRIGKTTEVADHIIINSTGAFEVNVKAGGNFKRVGDGVDEIIPVEQVKIYASTGSVAPKVGTTNFTDKASLTTTGHTLVSATGGGIGIKYSVVYDNKDAGANNAYIDMYKAGATGTESVYSANITYTITAS